MTDRRLQPDGAFAEWWRELFSVEGYDLQRVLAYGPGWETFEARVASGGEPVTLKVFTGLAAPDRRTRFLRAAERRASLKHPNLLAVQNFGETAGCAFLALERAACPSLAARLRTRALDPEECVDILFGVADAVEMAAQHGIITRDLAPDTILVHLLRGGLLGDLGIAQEVLGRIVIADDRLAYRSPEELRGEEIDLRASVYSLGAVAITAITGAPPHPNGDLRLGFRLTPGPPKLSKARPFLRASDRPTYGLLRLPKAQPLLPREITAVVTRAVAHAPEHRYASPREFVRSMAHALTASSEATRAPPARGVAHGRAGAAPNMARLRAATAIRAARARGVAQRLVAGARAVKGRYVARVGSMARERWARRPIVPSWPVSYLARARAVAAGRHPRALTGTSLRAASASYLGRASAAASSLWARAPTFAWRVDIRLPRTARGTATPLGVRHRGAAAAALLAVVASGAVGWLLAGAGDSGEPTLVANEDLRLRLPPGWTQGDRPESLRAPAGAVVASPPNPRGSGVIAFATRSSAAEMAERLLAPAGSALPRESAVRGSGFGGWRYTPVRFGPRAEGTAFVLPTTAGSIVIICYASDLSGTPRLPFKCRGLAASAYPLRGSLMAVRAASPAVSDLAGPIKQLRRQRAAALSRLGRARRPELQAREARDLERAYVAAARAMAAWPAESRSLGDLTDALRRAGTAYGNLARAAALEDAYGYEAARAGVRSGEQSVRRALDVAR